MIKKLSFVLSALALTGCATAPQEPPEAPISVQLAGTAVEVQEFIQARAMAYSKGALRVDSATDRALTMKAHCAADPGMNPMKCGLVMMAIGNSQWDGPYSVMTFRTNEVRGNVNLTVQSQWCATSPFGKTNCMNNGTEKQGNELLRNIKSSYEKSKAEVKN